MKSTRAERRAAKRLVEKAIKKQTGLKPRGLYADSPIVDGFIQQADEEKLSLRELGKRGANAKKV